MAALEPFTNIVILLHPLGGSGGFTVEALKNVNSSKEKKILTDRIKVAIRNSERLFTFKKCFKSTSIILAMKCINKWIYYRTYKKQ